MIYNKFYYRRSGMEWSFGAGKRANRQWSAKVYAGLMFGDIKDDFEKALDEAMVMELRAFLFLPVPMKNTFAVLRLIWIKEVYSEVNSALFLMECFGESPIQFSDKGK